MIAPVAALNVKPAGRVPLARLRVFVPVPPDVVNVALYAIPTVPLGVAPLITGAGFTVIATVLALCVPLIAACSVTVMDAVSGAGAV